MIESLDLFPLAASARITESALGPILVAMYMPSGIHTAHFTQNGLSVEKTVNVRPEAASQLQQQLEALNSGNKRAYFDFDHEDAHASAWPTRFFWQEGAEPGVYFEAELSASGRAAIEGRDYRCFSPIFHIEPGKGTPLRPANIIVSPDAAMNMGGFVNDPAFTEISPFFENAALAAKSPEKPANLNSNMSKIEITQSEPLDVLKAYNALAKADLALNPRFNPGYWPEKQENAIKRTALLAREAAHRWQAFGEIPLKAASAADSLGTLGDIAATRTLEMLSKAPLFQRVAANLSNRPIQFESGRQVVIPIKTATRNYDANIGADGRPIGFSVVTPAVTETINVLIDRHRSVEVCVDENTLAGTFRNPFQEQQPTSARTLVDDIEDDLLALITPANFNSYAGVGKPSIAVPVIDFRRGSLIPAARLLANVPLEERTALLSMELAGSMADASVAAFGRANDNFDDNTFPKMHSFNPLEYPRLPSANYLTGFLMHRSALALETGLPSEYWKLLPADLSDGAVSIISATNGLSALLVHYISHQGGWAAARMSCVWGVAVGHKPSGICVTSQ